MEVFHCIKKRRSVRKYLEKPVEWDKIMDILESAAAAPSAGNLQNWKFIVCANKANKEEVARACVDQLWISHAPVLIIVCAEPKHAESLYGERAEKLYNIQNCAAAAQNILLSATALGLSTCWVGAFDEEKVRDIFKMPAEARPQAIITLGYTDDETKTPDKIDLERLVFFEEWAGGFYSYAQVTGDYGANIRTGFENTKEYITKWLSVLKDKSVEQSKKIQDKIKKAKSKQGDQ